MSLLPEFFSHRSVVTLTFQRLRGSSFTEIKAPRGVCSVCVCVFLILCKAAVEAHLRWTCVKDEGSWMGWTDFLRESGETPWTVVGSSWFRLMICRASWVFPVDTAPTCRCSKQVYLCQFGMLICPLARSHWPHESLTATRLYMSLERPKWAQKPSLPTQQLALSEPCDCSQPGPT